MRTNNRSLGTRLAPVIGLLILAIFVMAPAEAWAVSGKEAAAEAVAGLWPRIKGLLLAAITQMAPPEGKAWLWPFLIGVFWLLIGNKGLRSKAHWVAYITPPVSPFVPFWWAARIIPIIGRFFRWTAEGLWKPVMGFTLGSFTIRELTMGTFGCAVVTGFLGGQWLHQYFGWGQYLVLIPAGLFGFVTMVLSLAEKAGGKAFKDKVARAGAPGRLWMRLRHGVSEADQYKCRHRDRRGRVCGHVNPITVRHCEACGAKNPRLWDCPDCGKKNLPAKSGHCPECGTERTAPARRREREEAPRGERRPTTARPGTRRPTPRPEPDAPDEEAEAEDEGEEEVADEVACPHCNATELASATFCGACGASLGAATALPGRASLPLTMGDLDE